VTQKVNKISINEMPRDEIEKESCNKNMIKIKTNSDHENKEQMWYKIKWTKILKNAIERMI
jgi:hypothetical protein